MSLSNCVGLSGLGIAFYWLAFTCRTASNSRVDSQLAHQNSHQSSFVEFSPRLASPSLCRNTSDRAKLPVINGARECWELPRYGGSPYGGGIGDFDEGKIPATRAPC
ncbi:hypothetical protein C8Q72DRAFT_544195 [Fomitopsis betulina]|nr:hypothetical protein C8Q72DRAFT_544195 [Fomitopsis betulina]